MIVFKYCIEDKKLWTKGWCWLQNPTDGSFVKFRVTDTFDASLDGWLAWTMMDKKKASCQWVKMKEGWPDFRYDMIGVHILLMDGGKLRFLRDEIDYKNHMAFVTHWMPVLKP